MSAEPQKYFFSVDEYYRMAKAGLFSEGPHVELIEGEVIDAEVGLPTNSVP